MNAGATFERVYRALKAELGSGRFRPGEGLEPAALSHELNSSITPVRDALHRLVGERLVEAPRGDGFRTPLLTEVGLRHLYVWSQWLLVGATGASSLGSAPLPALGGDGTPHKVVADTEALFETILRGSGNPEQVDAGIRLGERIRPVRHVEARLLDSVPEELAGIAAALDGPQAQLRRSLTAYHRRRIRTAAEIVASLQDRGDDRQDA